MMFKNQLQELAQRSCYNMPSYSCIKEGPDHAPKFKAIVNFNGEAFESPGYFPTLRVAEHAAAEVALKAVQSRAAPPSLSKILDETGVCKNLLQENAQRAGVPLPVYNTRRSGPGHQPVFTCTVEVAAMQFVGEPGKTKKQAEKNAALSAWASLRKKAGKRGAAPIEEADVTDEEEQKLIADILKDNLSERQPVRSSPAALAQNQHFRADMSPALLPSAPLYTRHQSRATQEGRTSHPLQTHASSSAPPPAAAVGGLLYKPRHVNASWVREQENPAGPTGAPRSSQNRAALLEGQPANVLSGNPYFPRQTHSSPHMHGHMAVGMRGGMPPNAIKDNHSIPAFPTQPLLSQAVPPMPGLGMPGVNQDIGPRHPAAGTTNHTGLTIRPGMAYQPRHARLQYEASPLPGVPLHRQVEPSWQTAPPQPSGGGLGMPSSLNAGAPVWRTPAPWDPHLQVRYPHQGLLASQMQVGIPPAIAAGTRALHDLKQEEDDCAMTRQVEQTAQLMLNHLCLE